MSKLKLIASKQHCTLAYSYCTYIHTVANETLEKHWNREIKIRNESYIQNKKQ